MTTREKELIRRFIESEFEFIDKLKTENPDQDTVKKYAAGIKSCVENLESWLKNVLKVEVNNGK